MKKSILKICAIMAISLTASNVSYGQWITSGNDVITNGISGGVGIGTSNVTDKLTIQGGNLGFHLNLSQSPRHIIGRCANSSFVIYGNSDFSNGAGMLFNGNNNYQGNGGVITMVSGDGNGSPGSSNVAMNLLQFNGGAYNGLFTVYKDAMTTIGTPNILTANDYKLYVETGIQTEKMLIGDVNINTPPGYRLYVQEGILTEKVKVALSGDPTNWSDFVFDDDYDLKPLSEVEEYIEENKHLPEIPSTEEVHANGLDLAQMDAKLLQKVEELTLYIIQQQKEINELKNKLNK